MKYSVKSKFVAAKPRKNRGNTASSGPSDYSGGSGNVVLTGSVESDGHTHANLASLNQIDTNPSSPDGYIYLSSTNKDNGDVVKTKAKSGFSDESAHALTSDEATHADVADIAHNLDDWSVADNRYLSRVNDDTAQGNLSFAKSIQSTAFKAASESFDGAGWAIVRDTDGLSTLVADNLRLRGTLTAHELVVRQVRAICGALGISQACGKVREADYDAESSSYHLVMEGDATHGYGGFQSGDFIRCQRFTQNGINGYWVQISDVVDGGRILTVQRTEFAWIHQGSGQNDYDCCDYGSLIVNDDNAIITTDDGLYALAYGYSKNSDASYNEACLPMSGDEIVQYGSSINKERQSAIYIHTDANGTPAIDLLEGIKTKSFDGCLRCRLGGVLPDGGFGLYVNNGTILSTGSNKEHYALRPDGSFNLGQGAIKYDPTNGIVTIADNVSINWGASSQEGVEYALSTDGVTPPTSGWTTLSKISSDKGGKYLWTRTRYPNGTYAYSVSYQAVDGVKGDKGDQGAKGVDGADGQNMRQNLADYTEFIPEIFEKKPDGITLNGIRKVGLDGCGALYAKCATAKDDVWMFQQNVISRLVPNEWYTISFYAKSDIASSSIAVYMRSGSTNSVIKLNEVSKLDGKDYTIKSEVVTFALSNVFVRHTFTFKTATTLPNNAYMLFRLFGAIKDAYITQVKLERSSVASDWCRSETDKVAAVNLPEWLDTWNGQTTSANAQYVAARNAFFGVRDTNDKYTGIMMSSEGLKINGESQAIGGLYALSNNEVKIAIDPTKSIYRFQGKVLCDGGQMEGLHVGASLNGITKVNKDNFLEIFSIKSKLSKYYGAPDFYIVNPVIVVESIPTTDTNGNAISGIMLPPYSSGANDYNLALGLLGKTLYIINKSSAEIGISGDCATSFNYAQYLSGGGAKTLTPMSIAEKKIASGKAATYTAHITSSGNIVWVVESNNGGNVSDLNTDISVLPPSGNDKWYFDKYTTNGGSGNGNTTV